MGFVVPPIIVPHSEIIEDIGQNLSKMFYISAGVSTIYFVVLIAGK